MRYRPFLLLEVLIALSILSLAILPFMGFPFRFAKEESKSLELMTLEREALNSFLEVQERFYKSAIPWKVIEKKYYPNMKPFEEKTVSIQLNKKLKGLYKQKTTIYSREKDGKDQQHYYLVKIKFEYQRIDEKNKKKWHTFIYPLIVEHSA